MACYYEEGLNVIYTLHHAIEFNRHIINDGTVLLSTNINSDIMLQLLNINNLKTYLIVAGIIAGIWFYKDYQYQKEENQRQSENIEQIRKYDSLKYASQTYTKKEFQEYIDYNRKDLKKFLDQQNINMRRIENIITQNLKYQDTVNRSYNLQKILDAIKDKRSAKVPFKDSTDCMIIEGYIIFKNDTLNLDITDRKFTNTSDVISYWQRKQWSFLGIKTRIFGKKEATVIIKDDCGRTETFVIDKK